jgi:hypothetical protein
VECIFIKEVVNFAQPNGALCHNPSKISQERTPGAELAELIALVIGFAL